MNFKRIGMLVLAVMMIGVWGAMPASAADPIKVKFAHISPPDPFKSPVHAGAVAFKHVFEMQTGGKYEVEIFPSGTMGKEVDVMEALQNNVIQLSLASAAGFHRIFPPAMLYYTPYIFRNYDVALDVVNSPFGKKLMDAFTEKTGIQCVNILGGYMYMAITNNKRPIRKPEDFKGLKFRVMDPMGGEMFKAFGASAVPIAWAETYTSLQTGVADGQTNPPFIIAWAKFNEVQKYMTLANSQWGYQMCLANKQWHDSLSPEDRRALYSATQAANATANGVGLLLERASIDALKKGGMEVIALTDQEIVEMQKVAGPHCLAWAKKALGAEWVDGLQKAIAEAEKKLGF